MTKKPGAVSPGVAALYRDVRAVLESARSSAFRAVNTAMVQAYWQVGRLIVEHEQGGQRRAAYGEAVLDDLSQRLTAHFGRGFDVTNLRKMRQFYQMFKIRDAVRLESRRGRVVDSYVRLFDANARPKGDNPTIGLILCARKNEAIAKYVKILPTEQELTREIEREQRLIDGRSADEGKR